MTTEWRGNFSFSFIMEKMIKIVIAAGGALAGLSYAAYKHFKTDGQGSKKSLGSFVVWGRPNAGKTTFINRLRGAPPASSEKEATTSKKVYSNIQLADLRGGPFIVDEIIDMPGTDDRRQDWIRLVQTKDHVFYIVNLERASERDYEAAVRSDVKVTINALNDSDKKDKRIHLIFSHLDKSKWSTRDPADVGNIIQDDNFIRQVYESMETQEVSGYIYTANLMGESSFMQLLQSIVDDCQA